MRQPRRARRSTASARHTRGRGVMAVAVLVGYLLALGGTSVGQGWRLLSHLAHAHAGMPPAPEVYTDAPPVRPRPITTLRAVPEHPHEHRHADGGHHHGATSVLPGRALPVLAAHPDADDGLHSHGEHAHTRDAPASEDEGLLIVSLDEHRVPTAPVLLAPPAPRDAAFAAPPAAPHAVALPVETPPPLVRG